MMLTGLFALCGGAAAQQVKVADMEALPGETVSLAIQIDTEGGNYTGLEFDIQFPTTGFTTIGNAVNTIAGWDGAFTIGDVGGVGIDNLARCALLSYTDTSIPGEGLRPLGTVEFTVDNSLTLGDYVVTLTNMTLIGDGRTPVTETTFKLSVVSVHNVVLDENAVTAPEATSEAVNVTLKRSIKAGAWSTIVLPFTASGEQVKAAFGNDVQLAAFTAWESEEDDDGAIVGINVTFTSANADDGIEANIPMLIKVSNDVTTTSFSSVSIEPEDEPVVQVGKKASQRGYFHGTFVSMFVPEENVFISNNKFYYSTGKSTIKGYRGYFEFRDVLDAYYDAASVKYDFYVDGMETRVEGISNGQLADSHVYDLAGRRVVKPNQRGIYIVNGKKSIVK